MKESFIFYVVKVLEILILEIMYPKKMSLGKLSFYFGDVFGIFLPAKKLTARKKKTLAHDFSS